MPKLAIDIFTKAPAEYLEERRSPTIYGPGKVTLNYWRGIKGNWRDGDKLPKWVLPDPPSG